MAGSKAPQTKRNRPGRPPRGEYVDKRKTLSTRITSDLRDRLDKSADESGRSLSQEIEFRLEQSFRDEKALYREFGGQKTYNVMRFLAQIPYFAEQMTRQSWLEDRETFQIVMKAIETILEKALPLPKEGPDWSEEGVRFMGEEIAQATFDHVFKSRKKIKSRKKK